MSYEWIGKIIEKKILCKYRNISKNQSEIVNKIPLARMQFFVQILFFNSKLERKNFTQQKEKLFRSNTCF